MYSVHRATVTRWLTSAKEQVFESFARDAASQMDATLSTFLCTPTP
jgi:hypothetical protein